MKDVLRSTDFRPRAAATRVLGYWRDRVERPLELLRQQVTDEHPRVRSSAVIGLPDDDLGNRVHAIVQSHDGTPIDVDELRAFVAERLVRYKVPRSFEFTAEALRDDAGKVRRSALREERLPSG